MLRYFGRLHIPRPVPTSRRQIVLETKSQMSYWDAFNPLFTDHLPGSELARSELWVAAKLTSSSKVRSILRYMLDDGPRPKTLPSHKAFADGRWAWLFDGPAGSVSTLNFDWLLLSWTFVLRVPLSPALDGKPIRYFLDWMSGHASGLLTKAPFAVIKTDNTKEDEYFYGR